MKKIIQLSLLLLLFASCASKKKIAQSKYEIKEGSKLFYEVKMGEVNYDFNLNMNDFTEDVISFDWDMDDLNSGTIAMNKNAITNATGLKNNFAGGYKLLVNQTSVWISIKLFKDLKSGKAVEIDLGNGQKETFQYVGSETFSFGNKEDGVPHNLPVFIIGSKDSKKEIWIHDDTNNRLIVMMVLEFRIDLIGWKL